MISFEPRELTGCWMSLDSYSVHLISRNRMSWMPCEYVIIQYFLEMWKRERDRERERERERERGGGEGVGVGGSDIQCLKVDSIILEHLGVYFDSIKKQTRSVTVWLDNPAFNNYFLMCRILLPINVKCCWKNCLYVCMCVWERERERESFIKYWRPALSYYVAPQCRLLLDILLSVCH